MKLRRSNTFGYIDDTIDDQKDILSDIDIIKTIGSDTYNALLAKADRDGVNIDEIKYIVSCAILSDTNIPSKNDLDSYFGNY